MVALRLILAVFAVLGVLSAPAGYMPARADDGGIILMICPKVKAPDPSPEHAMHAEMESMAHGKDAAGSDHDDHGMAKDSGCRHPRARRTPDWSRARRACGAATRIQTIRTIEL